MRGTNPIRPPVHTDGQVLDIVEIFPTLQGEGPHVGTPAVFIRLGGCNLACNFCDTQFETFSPMTLDTILAEVNTHPHIALVVITGGEPMRQPIAALCSALLDIGKQIQIETNGTLMRPLPEEVMLVCSPKASATGYAPLRPDVLERISALKFLISATHALYTQVPAWGEDARACGVEIFLQPMDEYDDALNSANKAHAIALCLQHGYRLSLQTHKWLGLR